MTEKEKMLAGEFYDPMDPQLFSDRQRAKKLCQEFNGIPFDEFDNRESLLKKLFQTENACYMEPIFFCDYGYNIEFGKNFYANHNCTILDVNKVKIGDNVWLGGGVIVCPGVKIGKNTTIAAGSVVIKDIPENVLAGGNPCRVLREL
jgi:maltose O-acetyltransferase